MDPHLQTAFKDYLKTRGIGENFLNFLLVHMHKKEETQYVTWLQKLLGMVSQGVNKWCILTEGKPRPIYWSSHIVPFPPLLFRHGWTLQARVTRHIFGDLAHPHFRLVMLCCRTTGISCQATFYEASKETRIPKNFSIHAGWICQVGFNESCWHVFFFNLNRH